MDNRYDVTSCEGKYAKNSNEEVLENKLDIFLINDINAVELILLEKLYLDVFSNKFPESKISFSMIKQWHYRWLGNIYSWAGQTRNVNLSKNNFMFAPAAQIQKLLKIFEDKYLALYTPCSEMERKQVIEAIAIVHIELILIHPFREGNGRLARLLADVMAVQGGLNPLNYKSWEQNKTRYIAAIHSGLRMNYEPMKYWVERAFD